MLMPPDIGQEPASSRRASRARNFAIASRFNSLSAAWAGPTTMTSIPLAPSIATTLAEAPMAVISK
jgi:hypothetical protein